jgi:endonuclease/exonuclease/phosphatase family metal-dependent hydrolase
MRVITWNVFHGRAVPERSAYLYDEFLAAIDGWDWDVLLLQECPPWWPPQFAAALDADFRSALTSRNLGLPIRKALATRRPDLIKANGGGCNAILVRGAKIVAHRVKRIRYIPERRLVHGVKLDSGIWICNLHLQGSRSHIAAPNHVVETVKSGVYAMRWAGEKAPILLGGDFNVSAPPLIGFGQIPGHRGVDQLFVRNLEFTGRANVLDRGNLSDHRPVCANLVT